MLVDAGRRRTEESPDTGGETPLRNWIVLAFASYLLAGLGTAASFAVWRGLWSVGTLPASGYTPDGLIDMGGGYELIGYVVLGMDLVLLLGAVLSTAMGLAVGRRGESRRSSPAVAAIATGPAVFVVVALLATVATILTNTPRTTLLVSLSWIYAPLVGVSLVVSATGAAAAVVGERSKEW